jgi:predicted DNA-binding transcriptional regulator YafY
MSHSDSIRRVIETINALNEGKTVCISRLAQTYDVTPRSIRRDLELIKDIFGTFITKDGECYRAYDKLLLDKVLSATELMQLSNIVNLLQLTQKDHQLSEATGALINRAQEVYLFKNKPFEQFTNHEILRKVEHTISFRLTIDVTYSTRKDDIHFTLEPYRIVFLNENFYLIGHAKGQQRVEFLRLSMIKEVRSTGKTFIHDTNIKQFIERLQTPFAMYELKERVIVVRVSKQIKKYFLLKDYLPSQRITEHYPNGDIQIEFTVTRFKEIEELLLKWMPGMRILSPDGLKEHMKRVLERKMQVL